MKNKEEIIELLREDRWYSIPIENTVDKIFSILGVSEKEQKRACPSCGSTAIIKSNLTGKKCPDCRETL